LKDEGIIYISMFNDDSHLLFYFSPIVLISFQKVSKASFLYLGLIYLKNLTMKKFLAVFDGYKMSSSTLDYAIQLTKLAEANLVGMPLFIAHNK
jgi:hypothetical protein